LKHAALQRSGAVKCRSVAVLGAEEVRGRAGDQQLQVAGGDEQPVGAALVQRAPRGGVAHLDPPVGPAQRRAREDCVDPRGQLRRAAGRYMAGCVFRRMGC